MQLEYDPSTKGFLIDRYPELSKYPNFSDNLGDKLLRYCILFFDDNSPFAKNRDLDDKKNKCFEAAKSDMEVRNEVEKEGERYRGVIYDWFNLSHSYTFLEWWSRKKDYTSNVIYLSSNLASFADPEKAIQRKNDIKKNLESDRSSLLGLENALFKDEKTKKMLTRAASEASLSGVAEKYAVNFFDELAEREQ